jgi:hypothetical protein
LNERGECQTDTQHSNGLAWGLWVNAARTPRLKQIEWAGLGMAVEVPKQIALAAVAMRVQVSFCWIVETRLPSFFAELTPLKHRAPGPQQTPPRRGCRLTRTAAAAPPT